MHLPVGIALLVSRLDDSLHRCPRYTACKQMKCRASQKCHTDVRHRPVSSATSIVLCVSGFTLHYLLFTFTIYGLESDQDRSVISFSPIQNWQNQNWRLDKDAGTQRGRLAIAKCLRLALCGEFECRGSLTFSIRRYVS